MKRLTFVLAVILLVSSLCTAFAISPDYLPQEYVSLGQSSEKLIVGNGEDGGITLVMPNGHNDMVITFSWKEGGVIDFLFYDYSGRIVWDSHDDPHWWESGKKYSVYDEKPIRTYEVGSNVSKIVVYCSQGGGQICTTTKKDTESGGIGLSNKQIGVDYTHVIEKGETCTEIRYYASFTYSNVREK